MLSRGFHDALALWPTVVWPILASSVFWAFLRLCRASQERYGFSVLNGPRATDLLATWGYLPVAALFEAAMHLYLLWVIGWLYAFVAIPVYILGWMAVPALLDDFGPGQAVLPVLHLAFAAALVVLLGFADIGVFRTLNAELYGLLKGHAVSL